MAARKNTNEVAKREETLPVALEELEAFSGQGFEEADKDAFAIPFIRILQKLSPQLDKNEEAYIEGAEEGQFFNTITGEIYGSEIDVIPVRYAREFIEWLPNRGGFKAAHGNDPSILDRVVSIDDKNNAILDNGNIIQDTRNHFVLLAGKLEDGPVILSLASSGIKHSRKWMSLMNNILIPNTKKKAPMFAGVWKLRTIRNSNDEGAWFMIGDKSVTAVEFERWVTKEELDAALAAQDLLLSGKAEVNYDSLNEERSEAAPF